MTVYHELEKWQEFRQLNAWRDTIGFVPTMGALHQGHLELVRRSMKECAYTIVSIFVNPMQFNNSEDLAKYPRTLESDLALLKSAGVHAVLLPTEKDIYPHGYKYQVQETEKSHLLCGAHRPGHFTGVLTIVLKLLQLTRPQRCYMGEKDFQQYLLVREMVADFFLGVEIVRVPTMREASGLAMSSRNTRLSPNGRNHAAHIYRLLTSRSSSQEIRTELTNLGFKVDYVEELWGRRFVAAWLENVRLIDNCEVLL